MNGAVTDHLEGWIKPQDIVVILIGIVREDAEHTHAGHFQKRVIHVILIATINQCVRERLRKSQFFIQFPNRQQPRVSCQLCRRRLYHDRLGCEKIERDLKIKLSFHQRPPRDVIGTFPTTP